jgi:hypothetical protein
METKQCITCNRVLPVSDYHQRPCKGGSKPIGECKVCRRSRAKKRHRENVERHRELVKKRYDTFGRFDRYGITAEMYEAALIEQGGKCKLCGTYTPGGKGVWHIDHAHAAGTSSGPNRKQGFKSGSADQFRGLLCHHCNISLGHFESLVDRVGMKAVADYLKIEIKPE